MCPIQLLFLSFYISFHITLDTFQHSIDRSSFLFDFFLLLNILFRSLNSFTVNLFHANASFQNSSWNNVCSCCIQLRYDCVFISLSPSFHFQTNLRIEKYFIRLKEKKNRSNVTISYLAIVFCIECCSVFVLCQLICAYTCKNEKWSKNQSTLETKNQIWKNCLCNEKTCIHFRSTSSFVDRMNEESEKKWKKKTYLWVISGGRELSTHRTRIYRDAFNILYIVFVFWFDSKLWATWKNYIPKSEIKNKSQQQQLQQQPLIISRQQACWQKYTATFCQQYFDENHFIVLLHLLSRLIHINIWVYEWDYVFYVWMYSYILIFVFFSIFICFFFLVFFVLFFMSNTFDCVPFGWHNRLSRIGYTINLSRENVCFNF